MSDYDLPVNIGNPTEMTMLEFAEEIIRATGSRSKIVFKPLPQDDPKQRKPDITSSSVLLTNFDFLYLTAQLIFSNQHAQFLDPARGRASLRLSCLARKVRVAKC